MFDVLDREAATISVDALEQRLFAVESDIGLLRAEQCDIVRRLDELNVAASDGARTMAEWVASRTDVSKETARDLVRTARAGVEELLGDDTLTFDRVVELAKYDPGNRDRRLHLDISGLRRDRAVKKQLTRTSEQDAFDNRYFAITADLDESVYRFHGQLPGYDGRVLQKALQARADGTPALLPDGTTRTRAQRMADALTSIAIDALTDPGPNDAPMATHIGVFVNALAPTDTGELSVKIDSGPRIGPETLRQLLCGRLQDRLSTSSPTQKRATQRGLATRNRRSRHESAVPSSTETTVPAPSMAATPPTASKFTTSSTARTAELRHLSSTSRVSAGITITCRRPPPRLPTRCRLSATSPTIPSTPTSTALAGRTAQSFGSFTL